MNMNGSMKQNYLCILCKKQSASFCQRCGDAYCSEICQKRDWPSHRYICFPMPPLVTREHGEDGLLATPNEQTLPNGLQQKPQNIQQRLQQQQHRQQQSPSLQQQQSSSPQQQQQLQKGLSSPPQPVQADYPAPNSHVVVTGFRSYNRCFVRSSSPEVQQEIKRIIDVVNESGADSLPLPIVTVNSYAICLLKGVYGRVQVWGISGTKVRVQFLDFGMDSVREMKELRSISDDAVRLRQYIMLVQLRQSPNLRINGPLPKYFDNLVNREYKITYGKDKDMPLRSVDLYDRQTSESLSQSLLKLSKQAEESGSTGKSELNSTISSTTSASNQMPRPAQNNVVEKPQPPKAKVQEEAQSSKQASPKPATASASTPTSTRARDPSPANSVSSRLASKKALMSKLEHKPVLEPPFEFKTQQVNDTNLKVMILDTSALQSGFFGCIRSQDRGTIKKLLDYMQKYEPNNEPYKPVLNEYVMALYEEQWYRAKCIEIQNDKYVLNYIDFTNEDVLACEHIRSYPSDFNIDCVSSLCVIDGFPDSDLTEEQLEFLHKWGFEIQGEIVIDNVLRETDGIFLVQCKDLIEKMRAAKLIE